MIRLRLSLVEIFGSVPKCRSRGSSNTIKILPRKNMKKISSIYISITTSKSTLDLIILCNNSFVVIKYTFQDSHCRSSATATVKE